MLLRRANGGRGLWHVVCEAVRAQGWGGWDGSWATCVLEYLESRNVEMYGVDGQCSETLRFRRNKLNIRCDCDDEGSGFNLKNFAFQALDKPQV